MKYSKAVLILVSCLFYLIPTNVWALNFIFESQPFSFQALRAIGYCFSGGADVGECLYTCYQIKDGDTESWYDQWYSTANRVLAMGDHYMETMNVENARECYFRASQYFRTAEFYLHSNPQDPRIMETWFESKDAFLLAASLPGHPIIPVKIPFEDSYLPGYLCLVDESAAKRPMIIAHSGFDGTKEELYFSIGNYAVNRGYNCLLFEGPGQGEVIREQNIHFRPDWETVVTPVVDYIIDRPYVDQEKIVLIGYSMGGYFAPRAVAYEHRISACVANGGLYSMYAVATSDNEDNIDQNLDDPEASQQYDQTIYSMMEDDLFLEWFFTNGMWTFGVDSPSELMRMLRSYTLEGCVDDISCNMLILDSENDDQNMGQAKVLYDSLKCPKEYVLFTELEGADEHCQMGAVLVSNEKIFSWLNEVLNQ